MLFHNQSDRGEFLYLYRYAFECKLGILIKVTDYKIGICDLYAIRIERGSGNSTSTKRI